MRGSIKLFKIFDISINIHITFFLLLALVLPGGMKQIFLVVAIFVFVTAHELCHSLAAKHFGIKVKEITLLPIGGVASMAKMPERPFEEFVISLAGPLFNIVFVLLFFYPMKYLVGPNTLFHPLSTDTWPLTFAYIYWINLVLAAFNLLPAFPMDGGRVLRAVLASRIGQRKATRAAVSLGHIFAVGFAYFGIIKFNIFLIIIAVFIYVSATGEEMQVDIKENLKKFRVRDILPRDFITLSTDTDLAKVLEIIFHSHQEDFPISEGSELVGFITRQDIMAGVHKFGMQGKVAGIMRKEFAKVKDTDLLVKVQDIMQVNGIRALPVVRDGKILGVVTIEDIGRVYSLVSSRT